MTAYFKNRIIELNNYLERMNFLYHTLGKPTISDEEYDMLYKELLKLEEEHPQYRVPGGITEKVGDVVLEGLVKARHRVPLLSLKKAHSIEEVLEFIKPLKGQLIGNGKLDGLALELVYKNCKLVQAITRGDGETGEDVTEVVKTIRNVPKVLINCPWDHVEVTGEVVLPKEAFHKLNARLHSEDKEMYSNPRNAVSGILRLLDVKEASTKPLAFFAYGIRVPDTEEVPPVFLSTTLNALVTMGFSHKRYHTINGARTEEETKAWVEDVVKKFTDLREGYDIEIDGIVFAVDNLKIREELGTTSQYPKHSIAYKFPASIGASTLHNVEWQVGRTGVLTPVALIDPVEIHGVTVSRVTLHNPAEIERLGIMINDRIIVSRQGDVIPKITKVITGLREEDVEEIKIPDECPVCASDTILNSEGNFLYCTGVSVCGGRLITSIEHFASREAMNIRGLGAAIIRLFVEKGYLSNIADIYHLHEFKEEMYKLEGFGKTSIDKLLAEIEKSKEVELYRFIYAIGINGVGLGTAKRLAKYFDNSFDELKAASPSQLEEIEDIGSITAELIYMYFQSYANLQLLYDIIVLGGVTFIDVETNDESLPQWLAGQNWAVTGSFDISSRKNWEDIIQEHGGKIVSSVTKNTTALLIENIHQKSSKLSKAIELGIPIILEREFAEKWVAAKDADAETLEFSPTVIEQEPKPKLLS